MKLIDQVLQPDNMRAAWEEVAENRGAPGVDDVSIKRWRRNWEERLVNLAAAVRANTYRPRRLRRFSVPKPVRPVRGPDRGHQRSRGTAARAGSHRGIEAPDHHGAYVFFDTITCNMW